jgi:hypothetical protein
MEYPGFLYSFIVVACPQWLMKFEISLSSNSSSRKMLIPRLAHNKLRIYLLYLDDDYIVRLEEERQVDRSCPFLA